VEPFSGWQRLEVHDGDIGQLLGYSGVQAASDRSSLAGVRGRGDSSHQFWDSHSFALRPITHPDSPSSRIYIQMVWLKDLDTEGGLASGNWDHQKSGTVVDFRRTVDDTLTWIRHGDVYEIETSDAAKYPIPSVEFLQIRYAVQKLLAGAMAAGALANIFSGEPPEDKQGPARETTVLDGDWDLIFEAAVAEGVLDDASVGRWRKGLEEYTRRRYGLEEADD